MTKSEVTLNLKTLEKAGYKVYTMNSHKPMPQGMKGFPDHHIIGHGKIFYVEVKLDKDTFSKEQREFELMAIELMRSIYGVFYYPIIDASTCNRFIDNVLAGTPERLYIKEMYIV